MQHISGDIAFALDQYWRCTSNETWLEKVAWPLASGIAQFWQSRVKLDTSGVYVIDGVIPPDEYAGKYHSVILYLTSTSQCQQ